MEDFNSHSFPLASFNCIDDDGEATNEAMLQFLASQPHFFNIFSDGSMVDEMVEASGTVPILPEPEPVPMENKKSLSGCQLEYFRLQTLAKKRPMLKGIWKKLFNEQIPELEKTLQFLDHNSFIVSKNDMDVYRDLSSKCKELKHLAQYRVNLENGSHISVFQLNPPSDDFPENQIVVPFKPLKKRTYKQEGPLDTDVYVSHQVEFRIMGSLSLMQEDLKNLAEERERRRMEDTKVILPSDIQVEVSIIGEKYKHHEVKAKGSKDKIQLINDSEKVEVTLVHDKELMYYYLKVVPCFAFKESTNKEHVKLILTLKNFKCLGNIVSIPFDQPFFCLSNKLSQTVLTLKWIYKHRLFPTKESTITRAQMINCINDYFIRETNQRKNTIRTLSARECQAINSSWLPANKENITRAEFKYVWETMVKHFSSISGIRRNPDCLNHYFMKGHLLLFTPSAAEGFIDTEMQNLVGTNGRRFLVYLHLSIPDTICITYAKTVYLQREQLITYEIQTEFLCPRHHEIGWDLSKWLFGFDQSELFMEEEVGEGLNTMFHHIRSKQFPMSWIGYSGHNDIFGPFDWDTRECRQNTCKSSKKRKIDSKWFNEVKNCSRKLL